MAPQIEILYRDQNILAVNKPNGFSVHNTEDHLNLMDLVKNQCNLTEVFPVHRLDKETSGIQILALNSESASRYATEFQNQKTIKIYHGVVRGQLENQTGNWTQPLTDKAEGRKNPQGISSQRVPCQTSYKTIQGSKYFTRCQFHLHTGRQHQIRKHAAINGHHLVGDQRYGDQKYNQKIAQLYQSSRMFLHCEELHILGLQINCPPPKEMSALFQNFE